MGDGSVISVAMTINGEAAPASSSFIVLDPATERPVGDAPEATKEQVDLAMDAAASAYRQWRQDAGLRFQALTRAADVLEEAVSELAWILTCEQGKPLSDAAQEVRGAAARFRYYANVGMPRPETIGESPNGEAQLVYRSMGVIAAITPWNVPVGIGAAKVAPALCAGNTVVLKPSPFTPLSSLRMGELLRSVFPSGVLNVISGGAGTGALMTSHPIPRKVTFTGSVGTGRQVNVDAAKDLKRVTLELGGNDPAILLDDVDLDKVADKIFWSAFRNNGQICAAVKRVYVPRGLQNALAEKLAVEARLVKVGTGTAEGTQLGPINNRPQFERVSELVADAIRLGGRVMAGGHRLERPGYFFEPTIISEVADGSRLVDEEQFGPALPIIAYDDVEEAIQRANGTTFGLGASVWGSERGRVREVARELESGTVWINTHSAGSLDQPFGGWKWSGIGVENGRMGLLSYMEPQVEYEAR